MRRIALSLLLLQFFSFTLLISAEAKEYAIRLHRPAREGDRYRLTASSRFISDTTTKAPDEEKSSVLRDEASAELDAVVTVRKTDRAGNETELAVTVGSCLATSKGETIQVIPAGKTITVRHDGKEKIFEMDGAPLDPAAATTLGEMIEIETGLTSSRGTLTSDDIFGIQRAVEPGESWPARTDVLADAFREEFREAFTSEESGQEVAKLLDEFLGKLRGSTKLEGVVKVGETECLELSSEVTIADVKAPGEEGTFSVQMKTKGKYPLDTSIGVLEEESSEMFETKASIGKGTIQNQVEKKSSRKVVYLK